jgi:hypothetical protein
MISESLHLWLSKPLSRTIAKSWNLEHGIIDRVFTRLETPLYKGADGISPQPTSLLAGKAHQRKIESAVVGKNFVLAS